MELREGGREGGREGRIRKRKNNGRTRGGKRGIGGSCWLLLVTAATTTTAADASLPPLWRHPRMHRRKTLHTRRTPGHDAREGEREGGREGRREGRVAHAPRDGELSTRHRGEAAGEHLLHWSV